VGVGRRGQQAPTVRPVSYSHTRQLMVGVVGGVGRRGLGSERRVLGRRGLGSARGGGWGIRRSGRNLKLLIK
jgi:hypothetical protein